MGISNSILRKVNNELNKIKTLRYDLERELNYPDQDYLYLSYWNCFYDFSLENGPIGFKYQIEGNTPKLKNSAGKSVYNGSEKFELKKAAKSLEIQESPGKKDFEGQSFFYNSLITLRNALTFLIEDKNVIKKEILGHSTELALVLGIAEGYMRIYEKGHMKELKALWRELAKDINPNVKTSFQV